MKNSGITLIELLIVISIVGILSVALGFSYKGWQGRYNVETTTKDTYSHLMKAWTRAMTRNRTHFAVLIDKRSYTVYADTKPSPDGNSTLHTSGANADTELPGFPQTVEYDLQWDSADPNMEILTFDKRGRISPAGTIFIDPNNPDIDADYDCINILFTRIDMGKWNGASCDIK
ncbi:MAG: type II secretion system protein [Nitrospiraceae bacterium]|nr:MAG: type II secretion system protein [Nitrospiraceae bacterium]